MHTTLRFDEAFRQADGEINFEKKWISRDGKPANATEVEIAPGEVLRAYDDATMQRIVLIGTNLGTVVLYEDIKHPKKPAVYAEFPKGFPKEAAQQYHRLSDLKIDALIGLRYFGSPLLRVLSSWFSCNARMAMH